ncbi:MAG TPA: hypothetical protein DCM49_04400 [Lachnospiraceae bacterium]|nr:hypothetical protein [Lachnospiraceae bacterium]
MSEVTYSIEISNLIRGFLTSDDWNYSFDEKHGYIQFGLNLHSRIKNIKYIVDVGENYFLVYAVSPIGGDASDQEMMRRLSEFIVRANYGLRNGNFELDMNDGEIRYKSFVDCRNIRPSVEVIKSSVYCPAAMYERYGSGMAEIIFNDVNAKEAIDKCENDLVDKDETSMHSEGEAKTVLEKLAAHLAGSDSAASGSRK